MTYLELLAQIKKIQEKLWNTSPYGNVSIMVGAGFSKNAIPIHGTHKEFPDWSELASCLLEALYPNDNEKEKQKRKNKSEVPSYLSKLAGEYIEVFSQKDLNDLIERSIPDLQYKPGKVHEELLKLPFKDIFTTNYDTLLERAASENYEREYRTITTKEQLSGSASPRIIKLHGSFPNVTPYIISEDHYRRYPTDYKPFVNTIIQSLIESTLILVGFSGEDPNFLNWIGWIRDELPDIRQKVYICVAYRVLFDSPLGIQGYVRCYCCSSVSKQEGISAPISFCIPGIVQGKTGSAYTRWGCWYYIVVVYCLSCRIRCALSSIGIVAYRVLLVSPLGIQGYVRSYCCSSVSKQEGISAPISFCIPGSTQGKPGFAYTRWS